MTDPTAKQPAKITYVSVSLRELLDAQRLRPRARGAGRPIDDPVGYVFGLRTISTGADAQRAARVIQRSFRQRGLRHRYTLDLSRAFAPISRGPRQLPAVATSPIALHADPAASIEHALCAGHQLWLDFLQTAATPAERAEFGGGLLDARLDVVRAIERNRRAQANRIADAEKAGTLAVLYVTALPPMVAGLATSMVGFTITLGSLLLAITPLAWPPLLLGVAAYWGGGVCVLASTAIARVVPRVGKPLGHMVGVANNAQLREEEQMLLNTLLYLAVRHAEVVQRP